ncbi:hypothetical protein EXIGLDRAFT_76179 [Exidia glandulosa HHB12029]|uniref:Uncharacterized protein n=1 Tax=Exidia glandulosa HHB12029 TaxID=1314781 RepID=A0A166MI48_EXIGL|nr:hypothetical protein EXIGLDRAFT_76179 [Exidia glandulosa HHB12029]
MGGNRCAYCSSAAWVLNAHRAAQSRTRHGTRPSLRTTTVRRALELARMRLGFVLLVLRICWYIRVRTRHVEMLVMSATRTHRSHRSSEALTSDAPTLTSTQYDLLINTLVQDNELRSVNGLSRACAFIPRCVARTRYVAPTLPRRACTFVQSLTIHQIQCPRTTRIVELDDALNSVRTPRRDVYLFRAGVYCVAGRIQASIRPSTVRPDVLGCTHVTLKGTLIAYGGPRAGNWSRMYYPTSTPHRTPP